MKMELKKTLKYEIETNLAVLDKTSTWLNIFAITSLLLALIKQYALLILCLLMMMYLKMKLDYQSGEVIGYYRKKQGIPNATRIKQIKEHGKSIK